MSEENTSQQRTRTKKLLHFGTLLFGGAVIFILISQLSGKYSEELKYLVGMGGVWGAPLYVLIVVTAIVVPPIAVGFLLPIAANTWGPLQGAFLGILGWTIGAQIAFWLARRFGKPLVKRVVSLEKIESMEKYTRSKNIFWSVVFLRMAIPVDLLSYALGLFSDMGYWKYLLATVIGVTPFGILFSYAAVLPLEYQITAIIISGIAFVLGIYFITRERR